MKVDGRDHAEPARSTPAPGQFQQVLQRATAPSSSPPSSPSRLPSPGKPMPRLPAPPASATLPPSRTVRPPVSPARPPAIAAPLPTGSSRLPSSAAFGSGPVLATSRSVLASPENLGQTRQAMHGEALRLRSVRTEGQTLAQEKTEHRLSELISQELAREFRGEPSPPLSARMAPPPLESSRGYTPGEGLPAAGEARLTGSAAGLSAPEPPNPQLQVEATLRLIEKIELFVQLQRPALRLSLGGPMAAMVEVERTGPREVALRIQGRHGPVAQEELARIQEGLEARGLRLRSLRAE